MITELTQEQKDLIPIIRDKWIRWAITPTNRDAASIQKNIKRLYKLVNLQPVPIVVCETLRDFEREVNALNKLKYSSVWSSVESYYWADNFSYYDFWKQAGIITDKKLIQRIDKYIDLLSDCSYGLMADDVCIVLTKPAVLVDEKWRLHSETQMALQWKDGEGKYFLQGIKLEKELWQQIVNKTLSLKEALQLKNTEQRVLALQYLGGEKVIKELGGKTIFEEEHPIEGHRELIKIDSL